MIVAGGDHHQHALVASVLDRLFDDGVVRTSSEAEVDDVAAIDSSQDHGLEDGVVGRSGTTLSEHAIRAYGNSRRKPPEATRRTHEAGDVCAVVVAVLEVGGRLTGYCVAAARDIEINVWTHTGVQHAHDDAGSRVEAGVAVVEAHCVDERQVDRSERDRDRPGNRDGGAIRTPVPGRDRRNAVEGSRSRGAHTDDGHAGCVGRGARNLAVQDGRRDNAGNGLAGVCIRYCHSELHGASGGGDSQRDASWSGDGVGRGQTVRIALEREPDGLGTTVHDER